jgi:hypothetical protein
MRSATISIPRPCTQSWANMTPNTAGRHCAACQETVADFTQMTDSEVVTFLKQYPSISCGQFRVSQLSRPLLAAAQPVTGWRRWWGATMTVLGVGSLLAPKAQAQAGYTSYAGGPAPISTSEQAAGSNQGATPHLASTPAAHKTDKAALRAATAGPDSLVISGVVRNHWGFRQAGARVRVRVNGSSATVTTTDEKGGFVLSVLRATLAEDATIRVMAAPTSKDVRYDYYLRADIPLDTTRTQPYTIRLKKHEYVRGGKFR